MLAIHAEEGEGSGQPSEPQPTPSPDQSFHEEQLSDIPSSSQPQKTQKHRKGRKLSNRVLDLEKAMTAQAKEIAILKKRVKKLEKRKRSRTQGLKLFKMGTSKRRSLDKEDASKHGRNLNARLISEEDDFDAGFDVVRDEGITHVEGDAEQVVIAAAEVVNAGVSVSTAEPKTPPTTTTTTLLEDDDVTVAATLVQMSETSKAKSIVFEDVEESAKEQREGKALMVEEDVPPQKQLDDERAGLEEAMRLQAEQEAGEKNELEKILQTRDGELTKSEKEFFLLTEHQGSWDSAQLKKLSDEEIKAKYKRLVRSIANFVPMGAEERVKRLGPELQSDTSKKQKTTEVKEVPVTEEPVKEPTAPKQEEIEQPIKKSGRQKSMARKRKLGQSMARKRKLGQSTAKEDEEYEKEKEELSMFLIIAFDEHKEVDYEILDQRSPIIAWNSEYYGPKPLHDEVEVPEEINMNVVTRLNGSKRYFSVLSTVLSIFDRDDLSALYQLVIDKYQDEIPKGFDLILWGDLTTMFHPNEEDDFWKSQEKWNIVSWKLHKSTGVHTLETDTKMVIHMLVEKKYPLMKKVLLQMLELKLESEDDSTMALELIKFIKQQI
ncbi:hypothetical protein Tco_0629106 [Tanacetum coccineum]|uniref:Uncharacterized protein n=1 Tax=Tanacetum coccineum TaxID=301880 RepID=A0ABQ4WS77_9ASTR